MNSEHHKLLPKSLLPSLSCSISREQSADHHACRFDILSYSTLNKALYVFCSHLAERLCQRTRWSMSWGWIICSSNESRLWKPERYMVAWMGKALVLMRSFITGEPTSPLNPWIMQTVGENRASLRHFLFSIRLTFCLDDTKKGA